MGQKTQMYIGTKRINAMAMNRLAYNQLRGWELPSDENGEDEGFLVEYVDGGKSNHPDHRLNHIYMTEDGQKIVWTMKSGAEKPTLKLVD